MDPGGTDSAHPTSHRTTSEATRRDLAAMRRAYASAALDEADVAADPVTQFERWFDDAVAAGLPEPNAMVVATSTPDAVPSARIVLLKGYDEAGFTFYSNGRSRKGLELAENRRAALLFPWHQMERQVRVEGAVEILSTEDAVSYFRQRPRGSQLSAWASKQSQVISGREELEERVRAAAEQFPEGPAIAPPDGWMGYRVGIETVEFWQGRDNRLHDRLRYRRGAERGQWILERLAP